MASARLTLRSQDIFSPLSSSTAPTRKHLTSINQVVIIATLLAFERVMVSENILIFGATGLIGTHITSAIVANKGRWNSISVFTSNNTVSNKPEKIAKLKEQGVRIITGDFTAESDVNKAYQGIDTVVSCVGRPVIDKQLLLIQLADKHPDVKRVSLGR